MSEAENSGAGETEKHFVVVLNSERQHSIWPAGRDIPAGWTEEGFSGSEAECLDHIESVWTDMRPASLH